MYRAYGLYSHIQKNRMKSIFLLASFVLLIHAVLFSLVLLMEVSYGGTAQQIFDAAIENMRYAWPAGVVAAAVWFAIAFLFHQRMIDYATRAKGIERRQEPELYNALENLCISRGISMPRLKVIESDALNAFAAGIRKGNYSVAVTRGLINGLSESELECVLAHELTHIRNKDTQMMVIAVIFAGIIAFIGDIVFRRLDFPFGYSPQPGRSQRRSERRSEGGAGVVVIILIALAVIAISWGVSVLIRFAISRAREILADAGAVELTKNPDAMIAALRRIERQAAIADVPSRMHAFFIESPALNPQRGWLSTHPSVDERVAALVQFAGGVDLANAPLAVQRKGPWS